MAGARYSAPAWYSLMFVSMSFAAALLSNADPSILGTLWASSNKCPRTAASDAAGAAPAKKPLSPVPERPTTTAQLPDSSEQPTKLAEQPPDPSVQPPKPSAAPPKLAEQLAKPLAPQEVQPPHPHEELEEGEIPPDAQARPDKRRRLNSGDDDVGEDA